MSIYQLVNLLACKLISFSACASWSLRACLLAKYMSKFFFISQIYVKVFFLLAKYMSKLTTLKRESLTCLLHVRLDQNEIKNGCAEARRRTNWGKYFKFENITNISSWGILKVFQVWQYHKYFKFRNITNTKMLQLFQVGEYKRID